MPDLREESRLLRTFSYHPKVLQAQSTYPSSRKIASHSDHPYGPRNQQVTGASQRLAKQTAAQLAHDATTTVPETTNP